MCKFSAWMSTLVIAASSVVACPATPMADTWPQRPVRLIVPTGAGATLDVSARLFAERLAERWKQPVVIENRPGADGLTAAAAFASSRDDHTLLFSFAAPVSVFPALHAKLPYDPRRDMVPISWVLDNYVLVAASSSLKVESLQELVKVARSQPGKLNYNASAGALPYVFGDFLKRTGLDMVLVSYREAKLAFQDLTEGRIHVMYLPLTAAVPLAKTGKVRLLAVTNGKRAPMTPEIPTAVEAGFPEFIYEAANGIFGPRDIPAERRDRIAADLRAVAAEPDLVSRLLAIGQPARGTTPAEFASALEEQRAKMEALVKALGKPQGQ